MTDNLPVPDDLPHLNLTPEEIQELRTNKQQITEYGMKKIRKLMHKNYIPDDDVIEEMTGQKLTDEKKEELAKMREENIVVAKISDEDLKKVLDAAKQGIEEYKPALEELADTEIPFYRFFVVEYYGTGEGVSYWLKACRNYESYDEVDHEMEKFKEFIGYEFYYGGIEELTEEEFRTRYVALIPDYVSKMLDKRDQPGFIWETHYQFNYS